MTFHATHNTTLEIGGVDMTRYTVGPRKLQRVAEYRIRQAMLDTGRTGNVTVLLAVAANEASERRRARLTKGGDGQTPPMTSTRRGDIYEHGAPAGSFTARQFRQLVRMDARTEGNRASRDLIEAGSMGMTTARGYTAPKGYATPKRPRNIAGALAGAQR